MSSLLILIPIALILGALGLLAFLWALKNGQFDDLDGASGRILFDDEEDLHAQKEKSTIQKKRIN